MERGIYAQGWYERGRCYHPSLPPRTLKMVEDFVDYRGTMITWPSLGGGGISLSYLEHEAWDAVAPRMRQYGFLNDSEFLTETHAKGVKAFSVIFSTQGWEFPAEFNEDEDQVLAMNELRGAGKRGWLGLREFTQNRYPKIWDPFEKYFPNGIRNSRNELVTDLFDEACGRDIYGEPLHADWLEVPEREHICHYMDINNPVWREYLKAIVRIHVDAGVDGIQFDEPDSPISGLKYGGCFCYDCLTGFIEFLQRIPDAELPDDVTAALPDFNYRAWLLAQGRTGFDPRGPDALACYYARFLQERVALNFVELVGYAREYASRRGRSILISANLYDGAPWTDPMAGVVDILVPEQRHTLYRQPGWMRFMAGFADGRPVCISFNPYGGIIPQLVPELEHGRSFDRFRVMLYEAAAMGVNMSVPYGAWMGAMIEDAMWAPHDETVEIQDFIADHEHLFSSESENSVAVVYSVESNFLPLTFAGALQARIDPVTKRRGELSTPIAFFRAAEELEAAGQPIDTIVFHDGRLREDTASTSALERYARVILPDCTALTGRQLDAVLGYLDGGGRVTVTGALGPTGSPGVERILAHASTTIADGASPIEPPQVRYSAAAEVAANLAKVADGAALHLINYGYDDELDATQVRHDVTVELDLAGPLKIKKVIVHRPGAQPSTLPVRATASGISFTIPVLGPYAIIEIARE